MDRARSQRGVYPVTPDGRYFVVRGRLWRRANPALAAEQRQHLVKALMAARRAVAAARRRTIAAPRTRRTQPSTGSRSRSASADQSGGMTARPT
jgi:hypothetical protein